jgi:SAM-dependent methyltransferase
VTEHRKPERSIRAAFAREDWNARYAQTELLWTAEPNRRFAAEVGELEPGRALDVACGEGRNAVWLAERGWRVTAVDFSDVAIDKGRALAERRGVEVDWVVADVLAYEPEPAAFDLAVVLYLQLPHDELVLAIRSAAAALRPGGTLFVLGHDSTNLVDGHGGPRDPSVLFTPEDVTRELAGFELERAEKVDRVVTLERDAGTAVAIDALVRAHRPA